MVTLAEVFRGQIVLKKADIPTERLDSEIDWELKLCQRVKAAACVKQQFILRNSQV